LVLNILNVDTLNFENNNWFRNKKMNSFKTRLNQTQQSNVKHPFSKEFISEIKLKLSSTSRHNHSANKDNSDEDT